MQTDQALRDVVAWVPGRISTNSSDTAVLAALSRGDINAFRVFVARHNVRLYRFALRVIGDRATAEDVVNQVFLHVWRSPNKFEQRSEVSTWLLAITRNVAVSAMRRRPTIGLEEAHAGLAEDPTADPEHPVRHAQRSGSIADGLGGLSPQHREIINLVYYDKKSIKEVAEIISVSPNAVKTRMLCARKELAMMLEGGRKDLTLT
jgi:RNA polymerase sigma-70 factor (ECF subfamily)